MFILDLSQISNHLTTEAINQTYINNFPTHDLSRAPDPNPSAHEKGSGNIVYNELFQWNSIIAYVTVYHVILHKASLHLYSKARLVFKQGFIWGGGGRGGEGGIYPPVEISAAN